MSRSNKKGFFQHPSLVVTRTTTKGKSEKAPLSYEEQRQHIFRLKEQEIKAKKRLLEENNGIIESLRQTLLSSGAQIEIERGKLEMELQSLREEERQKHLELQSCQQMQSIDPEQYKLWNEQSARRNFKAKMKHLRQEYQLLKSSKAKELEDLKGELEDIKNEQKELNLKLEMLRGEESNIVESQEMEIEESEEEIPDTDKLIGEIARFRESILDLEEENINLINKVKEDLDSSTWSVKERFNECRERIQKQIKKLTDIMEKSDNQVFRKVQNPDKIADPNNLIQDYQNRLKRIQDSLPQQLKEEKIFDCLKPLPWRSIKGINVENKSNSAIHQKFEKLMAEFTETEEENRRFKAILETKENEIETIKAKISQYQQKNNQIEQL